jgi:RimJ/RimL family protein N-acetyltransferase
MNPLLLGDGDLVLDQPTEADIPFITEYCRDPVFERFMTLPWPYQREHAEFFVREYVPGGWLRGDEVTWALRCDGQFLGVVGVRAQNSMIGFWLGAPHRGKGYMPCAVNLVLDWVFSSGWSDTVRWEAVEGNLASRDVARKTGFRYTGIQPALVLGRDGSSPLSWQATLTASDSREPKPGWPDHAQTGTLLPGAP